MALLTDDLATAWIDDMIRLVRHVEDTKPRDPYRAMTDALLDLRVRVTTPCN